MTLINFNDTNLTLRCVKDLKVQIIKNRFLIFIFVFKSPILSHMLFLCYFHHYCESLYIRCHNQMIQSQPHCQSYQSRRYLAGWRCLEELVVKDSEFEGLKYCLMKHLKNKM